MEQNRISEDELQGQAPILPMQCCVQPCLEIYHADNAVVMPLLSDESIDIICIDPPYLYLKGQKLERPFDEQKFFTQCKRLLKKDGFIIMFGRGESFYRWNTILSSLGFVFKEEVIWDKIRNSIPGAPLMRTHEQVSIHTKKNGKINRVRVPYLEQKIEDFASISQDIDRIKSALKTNEFDELKKYVETGVVEYTDKKFQRFYKNGFTERSRAVATFKTIQNGMVEKSVIRLGREHFNTLHPTQKPVRLIERLLALCIPERENVVVADFFAGSMSTMEAVYNMRLKGIAVEIDEEYFEDGKKRLMSLPPRQYSLFD